MLEFILNIHAELQKYKKTQIYIVKNLLNNLIGVVQK